MVRLELEAPPDGLQPEGARAHVRVRHPGSVVLDHADERSVAAPRSPDYDLSGAVAPPKRTVLDGVLDERLEK